MPVEELVDFQRDPLAQRIILAEHAAEDAAFGLIPVFDRCKISHKTQLAESVNCYGKISGWQAEMVQATDHRTLAGRWLSQSLANFENHAKRADDVEKIFALTIDLGVVETPAVIELQIQTTDLAPGDGFFDVTRAQGNMCQSGKIGSSGGRRQGRTFTRQQLEQAVAIDSQDARIMVDDRKKQIVLKPLSGLFQIGNSQPDTPACFHLLKHAHILHGLSL